MKNEPTKVMAFGTFDHLHAGHEFYLREAKKLGDRLIVVIARDDTVRNVKGEWPDTPETVRLERVKALGIAEDVVLGNVKDKHHVVRKFRPDTIALGYDQYAFTQLLPKVLIDCKLNAKIVRLAPYQPEVYKSSLIRAAHALHTNGLEARPSVELSEPVQK